MWGISAWLWKDRFTSSAQIVVVSQEIVKSHDYRSFVIHCTNENLLKLVAVDEAHFFQQWKTFRPELGCMKGQIRPEGISVPIVAMTGTCPTVIQRCIT